MQIDYDPFEPSGVSNYSQYRLLREHAPVHEVRPRTWVVACYDDVRFVLKNPALFSSDAMASAMLGFQPGVDPSSDPASLEYIAGLAKSMPIGGPGDPARMLILADPPVHTTLRAIVNRGFTPRRIAAWEARLHEMAGEAMARLRRGEDFDVVRDLAIPVPVTMISEMLGVEPERQLDFKRWSDGIIAGVSGPGRKLGLEASGFTAAMSSLTKYIGEIAAARRSEPRDDLVSVLVEAQGGEGGLSANEVVMFVVLLLVAGNETTTNLIGSAANALLDHPEQLALVRDDPKLLPALIEETLRYESPVQLLFRRATEPIELGGVRIGANDYVIPLLGSANRDERQFPDADRFDITRDAQGHLAFGFGQHFCLGASLARLEARCALEALIPELSGLAKSETEVCYVESFQLRGPRCLPLARLA